MNLDRANRGVGPPEEILGAIRHAVAAGACRKAAEVDEANRERWGRLAREQHQLARCKLHQAALSSDRRIAASAKRRASARDASSS